MSRHHRSAGSTNTFELLEPRRLWAVAAPGVINGLVIDYTVTSATGDYTPISAFEFRASADDQSYTMSGSMNGPGTFSYARDISAANVGLLNALDDAGSLSPTAPSIGARLSFTSDTAGTFEVTAPPHLTGTMSGTFAVTGNTTTLVSLNSGVLAVSGTVANDTVTLASSGGNITVTENNFTTTHPASSVTSIQIDLRDGNDLLAIGAGVPGVYCYAGTGDDNLTGGDGNDTLSGGLGKDVIAGGAGNDRLNGNGSRDSLAGGDGFDRLFGGNGGDNLDGGANADWLYGGNDNDRLSGGGSNDHLFGEGGDDTLFGNKGINFLDGGDGADTTFSNPNDILENIP